MKKIGLKGQLALFLFAYLVFLSLRDADSLFFIKSMVAVGSCVAADALFSFLKVKKFKITDSSVITGLIIGFVLSSYAAWWLFLLAGILAIASKHVIRFKGQHIFNPAGLGILLVVVIFKQAMHWHGAYTWSIIIPFGLYFVWRIRKLPIVYAYFLTYCLICGIQSFWFKSAFLEQIQYANYFFIFIMLIEPKTSPFSSHKKLAFGIMVSVMAAILYWLKAPYDAQLPALLIGNLVFRLYN
ncbi:RnfABCDGE type electron transport complex subunit D [Candidatus Omnitrophota bacterium]